MYGVAVDAIDKTLNAIVISIVCVNGHEIFILHSLRVLNAKKKKENEME